MNLDATFQKVLLIGFLVFLPIGVYFRIKSQATGEKLDRRQEGLFILSTLRPVGLVLWIGVIVYMINPARMAWSSMPLPAWLRWLGIVVFALAVSLLLWTLRSLGPNLTDTVVTRKTHTLVMRGPYRWVRHPFYDSAAFLMLSVTLMAANWFFLLGACAFMMLIVIRTRIEEDFLLARFGDNYRAYRNQTGRFLPRVLRSSPGTTP
jgi:protein-S-isoprenylcysteine O-methyltransferase Ste14